MRGLTKIGKENNSKFIRLQNEKNNRFINRVNEKKAQGNILVIILVVLMVIVGVVIAWNVVYPLVKQKGKEADTSFFNINLHVKEVVLSETGASKVSVERTSGEGEINSLKFVFYDENGQSVISSQDTNLPKELETKTYYFSPFSNFGKIKSVSVVPSINNKLGMEFKSDSQVISSFPPGLISWWRFDDTGDLLGKNNGVLSNANAQINNGNLVLDGGYFDVGKDASLSMNSQFAISAWINATSCEGKIISKGSSNKNYEVTLNSSNGKIGFTSGNGNYIESFHSIPLNNWTNVIVSIDWNGIWKIFINGNQEYVGSTKTTNPSLNNERVFIGEQFNGAVNDIMIFNKTLTIENINFLYYNQLK